VSRFVVLAGVVATCMLALALATRAHATSAEEELGLSPGYQACFARADIACVRSELARQAARLDAVHRRMRRDAPDPHALDAAHALWLDARDRYCEGIVQLESAGAPDLARADCHAGLNALRVRELGDGPVVAVVPRAR
jgi:uncharacterized protein YecT (DUF1311 family)